jgi:isoleucyl-tRNA synthetase
MSKSRGNVTTPWSVIDQHGADAMRWYLYTASPPGQERRFSADLVGEVLRNFTLTLWNTYSFFVTYANLDDWTPGSQEEVEYSSLDRWVRSTLHTLIRDVTKALENYDVLGATRPIQEFVEQLSNWYLRRSRRRFWKSESDADKKAAYETLYECLVTLSKLLAPTMPFIADEMYLNLVGSTQKDAAESVHLAAWPEFDPALIDEKLNSEMNLVMRLTSLGHAARNKANRKVRQPLSEIAFSVGNQEEERVVKGYAEMLADELNVKHVRLLNAAGEAVSYSLNPLPKQLGQKYGSLYPQIRKEIFALNAETTALQLLAGGAFELNVDGNQMQILPEEVEVRLQAREGYSVASEGAYMAALVTDLTPELAAEGLAREFVRRVQDARKAADLDIADRIRLYFTATIPLQSAVEGYKEYIMTETLTTEMVNGDPPDGLFTAEDSFDGEKVLIGIQKI